MKPWHTGWIECGANGRPPAANLPLAPMAAMSLIVLGTTAQRIE